MPLTVIQPSRVTVMIKPVGALCNLDCTYCYYLPTKSLWEGREHRMTLETLESVFAGILPRFADEVTIAWQGGEPTLAGLPFFRKALEYQEQYRRPHQNVRHALQTNGTLLDDEWCHFFKANDFLVGLSVDGPPHFHDHYRHTNRGGPSSDQVLRGLNLLRHHGVEYNILCVLNDFNVHHPDEILQYLLKSGSRWVQFIPAIEWERDPADPMRNRPAPYSPDPIAYGKFLCRVFDLWFEKYRKYLSIRDFDTILNKLVTGVTPLCTFDSACHNQLTIEHDGGVFGCDHFVERRWQLAQIGRPQWRNPIHLDGAEDVGLTVHGTGLPRIDTCGGTEIESSQDLEQSRFTPESDTADPERDTDWFDRVDQNRIGAFSARKLDLPDQCKSCEWLHFCYGGCPKHRPEGGDVAETTSLCAAYKMWYTHAMPRMKWLAGYLRTGRQPPDPSGPGRNAPRPQPVGVSARATRTPGRNDPCPCGSGLKFKHCHGRR